MQIIKQLAGHMDLDSPDEDIPASSHREMWNGKFNGPRGNKRLQGLDGNRLLPDQPAGTDGAEVTIGRYYDAVYARIFYFNYNSAGQHCILILNTRTGVFLTLIRSLITTLGDILNFDGSPIDSIGIIYGDPQEGDILCYVDSLGRPTKINIQRYLANTYGTDVGRQYIDVIKAPPALPPKCVYENDFTVTTNNLANSLFKFAYSYVYDDNEESVISSGSLVPLPTTDYLGNVSTAKQLNSRIGIFMNTGSANIKRLRIYMKQTQNGATSDWYLVDEIDKAQSALPNGDVYKYNFFNNGNYTPVDQAFATQLFDYVPLKCGNQAILNGNVLSYGDITEGYDWFKSTYAIGAINDNIRINIPGFIFFADYDGEVFNGQFVIKIVISGGDTVNVNIPASEYHVYATAGAFNPSFSFFDPSPSNNIPTLLGQIAAAAVAAGWTILGTTPNYVKLYWSATPDVASLFSYASFIRGAPLLLLAVQNQPLFAHFEGAAYSYGVEFFDSNGITNGVITDVTANVNTLASNYVSGELAPITTFHIDLNGVPIPSWGVTFAIVRTDNLTYSKYLSWVSNRTLNGVGTTVLTQYAYIDISNIDQFNEQEKATQPVVNYGFEQGDRLRFNARYKTDGTIAYVNYDYTILDLSINPTINGQVQQGRFLKIAYPTSDIAASIAAGNPFLLTDDPNFAHYNITIYHVSSNTTASSTPTNVYYEFGYKSIIGVDRFGTRVFFGNNGINSVLVQDGDIFYRTRTVPSAYTYYLYTNSFGFGSRYATVPLSVQPVGTITVTGLYTISTQTAIPADPFIAANYPAFSTATGLLQTVATGPVFNVRLSGTVQVTADHPTWADILVKSVGPAGQVGDPFILVHSDQIGTNASIDIAFDQTIQVQPGWKIWLIFGNGEQVVNLGFNGFLLRMDIIQDFQVSVYDKSYSDVYTLITNADNRPTVQDTQAKQLEYTTMYRWSQEDQLNSSINGMNRFYFIDFDEADKSYGPIQRMISVGKLLHILQYNKCGTVGIFQKFVKTNTGSDQLIVNDSIIEKNNIRYDVYDGGIGNQKSSAVVSNYAVYFVDPVKGNILRKSNDGVIILSLLYSVQSFSGTQLPKFLEDHAKDSGDGLQSTARVLGAFVVFPDNNDLYIMIAQSYFNDQGQVVFLGRGLSFDESDNSFEGFSNLGDAECIISAEGVLYTWFNGKVYIHDSQADPRTFFGTLYPLSIDLVWNEKVALKKTFDAIAYQSNVLFTAPAIGDITTSDINPQTGLQQQSQLIDQDGEIQENVRYFALLRDANSGVTAPLQEGDFLKGNWLDTNMSYHGTGFAFLFAPYIIYSLSNRNF